MSVSIVNNKGKFLCGDYRKSKAISSFIIGDLIAHTCDAVSKIKQIENTSKSYTTFIVDNYKMIAGKLVLVSENTLSRKYKNSTLISFI